MISTAVSLCTLGTYIIHKHHPDSRIICDSLSLWITSTLFSICSIQCALRHTTVQPQGGRKSSPGREMTEVHCTVSSFLNRLWFGTILFCKCSYVHMGYCNLCRPIGSSYLFSEVFYSLQFYNSLRCLWWFLLTKSILYFNGQKGKCLDVAFRSEKPTSNELWQY